MNKENIKLVYLISSYPAILRTAVLREILLLKSKGFNVCSASIENPELQTDDLTNTEKSEIETTYYLKKDGFGGVFRAHFSTLIDHPFKYFNGFFDALRSGGFDFKQMIYGFRRFVEAVMLGFWMQIRGAKHLHVHFDKSSSIVALIAKQIFDINFSVTVSDTDELCDVKEFFEKEKIAKAEFICCLGTSAHRRLTQISEPSERHKFEIIAAGGSVEVFERRLIQVNQPTTSKMLKVNRRRHSVLVMKKARRRFKQMKTASENRT